MHAYNVMHSYTLQWCNIHQSHTIAYSTLLRNTQSKYRLCLLAWPELAKLPCIALYSNTTINDHLYYIPSSIQVSYASHFLLQAPLLAHILIDMKLEGTNYCKDVQQWDVGSNLSRTWVFIYICILYRLSSGWPINQYKLLFTHHSQSFPSPNPFSLTPHRENVRGDWLKKQLRLNSYNIYI